MNERTDAAVLAALAGNPSSASELSRRTGLPLGEINSALARLATERKVARALVSDDGFVRVVWSLHQLPPRARAEAMVLPIAAE